jgi:hypothetical protein
MLTNKIIFYITTFFSIIMLPIVPISTLLLGLLVSLSFGLLLIPISLVWSCFYFPLLGLSFVWEKYKILRPFALIIGIPLAILAYIFVGLMPSMGENDSKMAKLLSATTFPFTYSLLNFNNPKKSSYLIKSGHYKKLLEILYREKVNNPIMTAYIDNHLLNK